MNFKDQLIKFLNLLPEEMELFDEKELIAYYLKCYKKFSYNNFHRNVIFYGLDKSETKGVSKKLESIGIITGERITVTTVIVSAKNITPEMAEKANKFGSIIIPLQNLEEIIDMVNDNFPLITDNTIESIFRIPKPLNYNNIEIRVSSFSGDDSEYITNLFDQACTCGSFTKKLKDKYPKGDIRRLCKHLKNEYAGTFDAIGLNNIQIALLKDHYPVKHTVKQIRVPIEQYPIYLNYETLNDWITLLVTTNGATYNTYGYHPIEKRYSNGMGPKSSKKEISLAIDVMNGNAKEPINQSKPNPEKEPINSGCLAFIIIAAITITIYLLKIIL